MNDRRLEPGRARRYSQTKGKHSSEAEDTIGEKNRTGEICHL